ncbi:MAG: hypothetical protein IH609_20655, partial [Dehalococcoidia bacterium]|nr:hypothetical protein [Dehalococcoidia bacterium]
MAINHYGRWRIALLGLLAAATILTIHSTPASSAATTAEGPLSPVSTGVYTQWNRGGISSGAAQYTAVNEPSCTFDDSTYLTASSAGYRFSARLALDSANNGKRISRVDVAVCHRVGGASALGSGFSPFVRLDGVLHDGTLLSATSSTGCVESFQSISIHPPVDKSDATSLEIGAVKSDDNKAVRVCAIRATIYYEDDEPPPPPEVAKSAATPPLDADSAYWDITIDNSAAGAVARDEIVVTDGEPDAVLESVTPVGACAGASGALSPWTCDVAAGGTTVLRVSRPRSALTDA